MKRFLFLLVMISGLLVATGPVIANDLGPPGIEIVGNWDADRFSMDLAPVTSDVFTELQTYLQWKEVPQVGFTKAMGDLDVQFAYTYPYYDAEVNCTDSANIHYGVLLTGEPHRFLGPGLIINKTDGYQSLDYTG